MPILVTRTLVLDLRGARRRITDADVRNRLEAAAYRAQRATAVRLMVDADTPLPLGLWDLKLGRVTHWAVESTSDRALDDWDRLLSGVRA